MKLEDIGTEGNSIFLVQRKIAFLAFIAGFLISVINFVNFLSKYTVPEAILKPAVFFLIIFSTMTLLTGLKNSSSLRLLQVLLAFANGAISILDVYNSIHGLGLIMLSVFLAFKYGFLKKRFILKSFLAMVVVFTLVMISAQLDYRSGGIMFGLNSIIYLSVFLAVTYVIYQDEITEYILRNREAESEISVLQNERSELAHRLSELDSRIAGLTVPVDLEKMGLTKKEMEVLEVLILYRETEHELADRLGMSFHTLKNHFRHIRDKLGVDKREDIIEMCRNNFS
ncbi:MAG TPA: hypothetical protein DCO79_02370 [Spirochaeta sp.]|nr:hypothetical protein [Spirochaeta sp.]